MTNPKPAVSVIMPVYNGAKYIAEAVQSVLDQTYKNFELIIIDDGSVDSTLNVLQPYAKKLQIIELQHKGVSAARNAGIHASRGEFIAFIDSDDVWEKPKLELQIAYLNSNSDVGLVYSYSTNFTNADEGSVALLKKIDHQGYAFKALILKGGVANSTVMVRESVLETTGIFDESLIAMEDYDLYLRISRKYKIGRIPRSLMRRRIHQDSFYTSGYDNQYIFQYPVYEHLLSEPTVAEELGTTKAAFMSDLILKFIYKNLYDNRIEFTGRKLKDLKLYAPKRAILANVLVSLRIKSPLIWRHLITDFEIWHKELAHKAALFAERQKINLSAQST